MRISIFGVGYVGVVSSGCLVSVGHTVVAVDVAPDKVALINQGKSPIVEVEIDGLVAAGVAEGRLTATTDVDAAIQATEISFISVGTPSAANGSVSMTAVEAVLASIGQALRHKSLDRKSTRHTIVMRSTVPPGTAETVAIPILERESGLRHGEGFFYYSNPEFLREGSSVRDFHAPPFTLIGAPDGDDAAVVREIYAAVQAPVHVAPYKVAESAKYLSNVYHAVKLAFANEAGAILAAHGVDARESFRLFCEDRVLNISPAYLRPGFAFGGSCLPKDIRSFLALADDRDIPAPFLSQVLPSNQAIIDRTYAAIAAHGRQQVTLFGLAFKNGTDDLRESPFVLLAEKLIGKGFALKIFDRSVETARLTGSNRAYIEREIPHIERFMVGDVGAALDGSRIVVVGHIGSVDRPALLAALGERIVIDLAGMPDLQKLPSVAYQGLCW
jgi:GDP-mannose 6-dehydrogenase